MLLLEDRRFYVYIYLDPRKSGKYIYNEYEFKYEPFYVGKGCGRRIYEHLENRYLSKKSFKNNIIKKILREGYKPILIKLIKHLTNIEAYKYEIDLISKIGRRDKKIGPLTNKTDGGSGSIGFSQETIKKLRISRIGNKNPMFGTHPSKETRKLLCLKHSGENNRMYGKKHSLETRNKMSKNSYQAKQVIINDIIYKSVMDASRCLLINHWTIRGRLESKNFQNYQYTDKQMNK